MVARGIARGWTDRPAGDELPVARRHARQPELAEVPVGRHLRGVARRVGRAEHEATVAGPVPEHRRRGVSARRVHGRVVFRLPDRDDDGVGRGHGGHRRLERIARRDRHRRSRRSPPRVAVGAAAPHDRRGVPADGLVADREEPAVDGGDALDRLRTRAAQRLGAGIGGGARRCGRDERRRDRREHEDRDQPARAAPVSPPLHHRVGTISSASHDPVPRTGVTKPAMRCFADARTIAASVGGAQRRGTREGRVRGRRWTSVVTTVVLLVSTMVGVEGGNGGRRLGSATRRPLTSMPRPRPHATCSRTSRRRFAADAATSTPRSTTRSTRKRW